MDEYGKRKLIVGLDFGTTHTGIKYAMSGDEHVEEVNCWPLGDGKTIQAQKNPTLIAYLPEGSATPWGYQIESQENICAWMKYHLDKLSAPSPHDDPRLTDAIQKGLFRSGETARSPDRIAIDYMKEVLKAAVGIMEDKFREVGEEDILEVTSVEWWVVRPAVWSTGAVIRLQEIVQTAAKEAKFHREGDKFNYVTEAEAASFCVLFEAAGQGQLMEDDVVMVCDGGGGTVDVAVYEIPNTLPMTMKEVVAGLGGKCGSSCIELEFHHFMRKRFGKAYDSVDPSVTRVRSRFMTVFEGYKHAFSNRENDSGADEPQFRIPLDMTDVDKNVAPEHYRKEDRVVVLTRSDMQQIFEPTAKRVLGLIKTQYNEAVTIKGRQSAKVPCSTEQHTQSHEFERPTWRLMLAGGFARSKYLQAKVQDWCREVGIHFRALDDIDSWGAIAHGAVLKQIQEIHIEKRLSRFHTGVICAQPYDADADAYYQQDVFYCRINCRKYTDNCVEWFSHRGDIVDEHSKNESEFFIELEEDDPGFDVDIVTCSAAKAPRHYSKELVSDVGLLHIQLRDVDMKKYKQRTPSHVSGIEFKYIIEETMGSAQGSLMYRAIDKLDRQPVGDVEVQLQELE